MPRTNRTQKYAALWLHSQGWDISKISNELDLTDTQIKRIVKECGLNWDEKCLLHHKNLNPIKTMSTTQARQPIYKTSISNFDKYKIFLEKIDNSF